MLLADYTSTITGAQLAAAGYGGAIRYLAPPDTKYDFKRLTAAERDQLFAAGRVILGVFESYATRALEGAAAGVADAQAAVAAARALGYPDDVPIIFACDTDTTADLVRPYFKGAASIRPCLGGYGGRKVTGPLIADGTIRYAFQSCAWSMPSMLRLGSAGPDVRLLQTALGVTADGAFGPLTQTAVKLFQSAHGLTVDGIVGPATWDQLGTPIDPGTHIYQRYRPTTSMAGSFDEDIMVKPVPLWAPAAAPAPPAPLPASPAGESMVLVRDPSTEREYLQIGATLHYLATTADVDAYTVLLGHAPQDVSPGFLAQFPGYQAA